MDKAFNNIITKADKGQHEERQKIKCCKNISFSNLQITLKHKYIKYVKEHMKREAEYREQSTEGKMIWSHQARQKRPIRRLF